MKGSIHSFDCDDCTNYKWQALTRNGKHQFITYFKSQKIYTSIYWYSSALESSRKWGQTREKNKIKPILMTETMANGIYIIVQSGI